MCKYTPSMDGWDGDQEYCVVHAESVEAARKAAGKYFYIGEIKYKEIEIYEIDIIEA